MTQPKTAMAVETTAQNMPEIKKTSANNFNEIFS